MSLSFALSQAALAQLAALPRYTLGHGVTPLHALPRVSAALGGPKIWIKRDDCTGLATGGNKTRKLELLLGDAQAQGCNVLITQGALQSNHARQVAAAGAVAGWPVHVVLSDAVPGRHADYQRVGNLQLCRLLGAQVHMLAADVDADAFCAALAQQLQSAGQRPYVIPMGGSNGLGALGYTAAFAEIHQQMQALDCEMDAVVLATGSGGTQAGLMLGACLQGWSGRIHGVSVGPDQLLATQRIQRALADAAGWLDVPAAALQSVQTHVDVDFKGPHYGIPAASTWQAVAQAAQQEGVLLDPVYSGKGFAGLLAACAAGGVLHTARHVVFLHTGGVAAMSAYPEVAG